MEDDELWDEAQNAEEDMIEENKKLTDEAERAWHEAMQEQYEQAQQELEKEKSMDDLFEELYESEKSKLSLEEELKTFTFENLVEKLSKLNYSENTQESDELLQKIKEKYVEEIRNASKTVPNPKLDYTAYAFARSSSILSLEFSWVKINMRINALIADLKNTSLSDVQVKKLEDVIDTFYRKCIKEIIDFEKPKDKQENEKLEPDKFEDIMKRLPDIYSSFYDVFLDSVQSWNTARRKSFNGAPESLKFRAYNLDLRNKKNIDLLKGKEHNPNFSKCDYDYYFKLEKDGPKIRGFLFQGYWEMQRTMTELRNLTEHWKKSGSKSFLNRELGRTMIDPISETESLGNFIILISILLLICYDFIGAMQAWIDTDTILKKDPPKSE